MISIREIESLGYRVLANNETGYFLILNKDYMFFATPNRFTYLLGPRQKEISKAKELKTELFKAAMLKAEKDIKSGLVERTYLAWKMK